MRNENIAAKNIKRAYVQPFIAIVDVYKTFDWFIKI